MQLSTFFLTLSVSNPTSIPSRTLVWHEGTSFGAQSSSCVLG